MITTLRVATNGPACHEVTGRLSHWLTETGAGDGMLTLMIRHTSASLLIQENADPEVQVDLLNWLDRLAPPADHPSMGWITHRYEGPDDMPAHLKAALLPTSLQIPVQAGQMLLGRWQGVYLVEHRARPHDRQIAVLFQSV
ncbi:MAG: secondary thiamine-phosphate synthase enzyme YjbQ [Paracoccus sp. (in: a-proteobacteria)]